MSAAYEPFAIRVVVPARSEFLHLLRLNVAGVLGDAGFSIDEIDDVKIAVEELTAALLHGGRGDALDVSISIDGGQATVTGLRSAPDDAPVALDEFVTTILDAVVDSYRIDRAGDGLTFTLRKRASER